MTLLGLTTPLTVGSLAQLTAPLPFDSHRLLALFGKAAAIGYKHPVFIAQVLTHFPPMSPQDGLVLPTALTEEVLHVADCLGVIPF